MKMITSIELTKLVCNVLIIILKKMYTMPYPDKLAQTVLVTKCGLIFNLQTVPIINANAFKVKPGTTIP